MFGGITADSVTNLSEIEKQWSVKAMHHAEVYFKLINTNNPSTLRLTRIDGELYTDFRAKFPDMNIDYLSPDDINGSAAIKEKWRSFIMPYEHRLAHYNFGTLLRLDAAKGYTEENTYFAMRSLSDVLATGLSYETLEACVELCELGVNPEALAILIKELSSLQTTGVCKPNF